MTRIEALTIKSRSYPYEKNMKKLTESEFDTVVAFIDDNDYLGHLEFEYAVNRMFLDGRITKTKNWSIMMEILTVVNTAAYGTKR